MGLLLVSTQSIYAEESPRFEEIADVSPDGEFGVRISCVDEPKDANKIKPGLTAVVKVISLASKNRK